MIKKDIGKLLASASHMADTKIIALYKQAESWSDLHDLIKRSYFFTGRGSGYGKNNNRSEEMKIGSYVLSYESSWSESRSHVYASDEISCVSDDKTYKMSFGDVKKIMSGLRDMLYKRHDDAIVCTFNGNSCMTSWYDPLGIKPTREICDMTISNNKTIPASDFYKIKLTADLVGVRMVEKAA